MHFSLLEKLGGAALICAWIIFGANSLGDMLVRVEPLAHPAIEVATAQEAAPAAAAAPKPKVDFNTLLAQATPAAGEKVFNKCKACHSIEEGGPIKVGPNLWGIVGGPMAHEKDFNYSEGLAAMGAKGDKWTYEHLNKWLDDPKDFIKGTKMTFAGLKSDEARADVIAYLRAQSKNPPPLPQPAPAASSAQEAAPAAAAAPEPKADFKALLAQATPAAGEKVFNKCKACHSIEEGGPIKVGPNLWGIVGGPMAHEKDFNYSDGLAKMAAKGDKWTYDALNEWLTSPKDFVKGTKMTFAGLKSEEDRADVIAYLRAHATNPPPLP